MATHTHTHVDMATYIDLSKMPDRLMSCPVDVARTGAFSANGTPLQFDLNEANGAFIGDVLRGPSLAKVIRRHPAALRFIDPVSGGRNLDMLARFLNGFLTGEPRMPREALEGPPTFAKGVLAGYLRDTLASDRDACVLPLSGLADEIARLCARFGVACTKNTINAFDLAVALGPEAVAAPAAAAAEAAAYIEGLGDMRGALFG